MRILRSINRTLSTFHDPPCKENDFSSPSSSSSSSSSSSTPCRDDDGSAIQNDFKTLSAISNNVALLRLTPILTSVGAGLQNLGNSCFMNSILQCFTHTVPLVQGLRSCNHACDSDGFCVVCVLHEHIEKSLAYSEVTNAPRKFFDNLSYFSPSFVRNQQEDAHEFMQCVLNKLRRCFPEGEDNLVEQVFGGRLISTLRCCKCGHSSDTYEPLIDLSIDIEEMNTLQLALESFTKMEQIDGLIGCATCKQLVFVEKQLKLDKPPLIAAFHLKRFRKNGSFVQKNTGDVNFTLELDLQPYTSSNSNEDNELLKYDLYAAVEHTGYSPDSGHYICYIRSAPDKWHQMDDNKVFSVSEEFVLGREAYLLFYARRFSSIMEDVKSDLKNVEDYIPHSNDEQDDVDIVEAPSVSGSKCNSP